jgi:hypothetical protein
MHACGGDTMQGRPSSLFIGTSQGEVDVEWGKEREGTVYKVGYFCKVMKRVVCCMQWVLLHACRRRWAFKSLFEIYYIIKMMWKVPGVSITFVLGALKSHINHRKFVKRKDPDHLISLTVGGSDCAHNLHRLQIWQ